MKKLNWAQKLIIWNCEFNVFGDEEIIDRMAKFFTRHPVLSVVEVLISAPLDIIKAATKGVVDLFNNTKLAVKLVDDAYKPEEA